MISFKTFCESRTFRNQAETKIVYHFSDQGEWKEVMKKQELGLWVAPNLGQDLNWGGWIVAGSHKDNKFYLHKLAVPSWLYDELMEFERGRTRSATDPFRANQQVSKVTELVIPPKYWKFIIPLSKKTFRRSEVLKMANKQRRLESDVEKRPKFRNPTKKRGMDVLPTGEVGPSQWEKEEYRSRAKRRRSDDI